MRRFAIALLLAFALAWSATAQPAAPSRDPRVEWLRRHALRVRSVSPADRDFSDLQPLEKSLSNAQVVLLGEQSHGDGTTFLAKARLIQFLHEEMGFDVLAFESGLYDCRKTWEALRKGEDPVAAFRLGLFPIWTESAQVRPLLEYISGRARTSRPLEVAGFDLPLTGEAGKLLASDLLAYLRGLGSEAPDGPGWAAFTAVLPMLDEEAYALGKVPLPAPAEQERFLAWVEALRAEISTRTAGKADPEAAFWRQVLESMAAAARADWVPEPRSPEGKLRVSQIRDGQMGRNLIWLANERYAGRKIVVWAATAHAVRNLDRIDLGQGRGTVVRHYQELETMGEVAWKVLGDRMYVLGFTAAEGKKGHALDPDPATLPAPGAGSLEDLMARAGLDNAIVDFRKPPRGGDWLRRPLVSRPLGYWEMKADWGEILDGMMFTRVMEPSRRADR